MKTVIRKHRECMHYTEYGAYLQGLQVGNIAIDADGTIWNFRTFPEGKGCGLQLLKFACNKIRKAGQVPSLYVNQGNEQIIPRYEKMGFVVKGDPSYYACRMEMR